MKKKITTKYQKAKFEGTIEVTLNDEKQFRELVNYVNGLEK